MKVLMLADKLTTLNDMAGFLNHIKGMIKEIESHILSIITPREEIGDKKGLGFDKIYLAISERAFPDQVSRLLEDLYRELSPDLIVGPATKDGNEILARLSERLTMPMLTEITDVIIANGELKFKRAIMGGRVISTERPKLPACITIPLKKYPPPKLSGTAEVIEVSLPQTDFSLIEVKEKTLGIINIEDAEIVIGVGRGFRSKEDLKLAQQLADLLGGAVGCSRPIAADYGWLPEDAWIGISGKRIRPKLYIPIGISGAPQHMTAAMDSKIIVAINKDKNAPVFQYTDYGVVADLYKFLPILIEKIKERLKRS